MKLITKLVCIPAALLLLTSFQNCSRVQFNHLDQLSFAKSENGSVFDGKPSFYLTHPDYSCEGQLSPVAVIRFSESGPRLTYNQNDHCGALQDQPIDLADVDQFSFDPDFIGYRDGIYEKLLTPPDLNSPVYNEAWCQSTDPGTNVSVAIKYNAADAGASAQLHYVANGGNGVVPYFSVNRAMSDTSALYATDQFRLSIDRSQPAPQKWWYFKGVLETTKIPAAAKTQVLCRMAASKLLATVQKVYPKNADWNSYVKNADVSKDAWSQQDQSCTNEGSWNACVHGGDKLTFETELKNCAELIATDQLGNFNWVCEDRPSGAVFKALRLKKGRALSDLVTDNGWKANSVQVLQNGHVRYESISLPWWKNAVVPVTVSGSTAPVQLQIPKAVYVVSSNLTVPGIQIAEDGISLVVRPGATITGLGNMNPNCNLTGVHWNANDGTLYPIRCLLTGENRNFLWIEGTFDSAGSNSAAGVNLVSVRFAHLHNVQTRNATTGFGVYLQSVQGSVFDAVNARGNRHGLVATDSTSNLFGYSQFSNNSVAGLSLMAWDNRNTIVNSEASQNGQTGFSFTSTKDLVMVSTKTLNNTVRGYEITGFTENAIFESAIAAGDSYGFDISRSDMHPLQPDIFRNAAAISKTMGLRVFEGSGANKEVFDGGLYLGSPVACTIITVPASTAQMCPGSGSPGGEIFTLPTTKLTVYPSCKLSATGEDITCQSGASTKSTCQLRDRSTNPLISWSLSPGLPMCAQVDALK